MLGLWAGLFLVGQASAQCALCKQALESGGNDGLIEGFQWSVLLLLGAPLLLIGGIGSRLYFTWRATQR
ncbi:MAG: hypothetical protein QF724_11535 [Planctomycetota bacterium]|nr:hypothetical protein [Planctomycetota bacterium]MDP6839561.1 hypothetical protein [Planctomycetota bacterium]